MPKSPCSLLTLQMAQAIFPEVPHGMSNYKPPTGAGCFYGNVAQIPETVTLNVYSVSAVNAAAASNGSPRLATPRQTAANIVATWKAGGTPEVARVNYTLLSGPGQQSVYIDQVWTGGGSLQEIIWMHGDIQLQLSADSVGRDGSATSHAVVLEGTAGQIDKKL